MTRRVRVIGLGGYPHHGSAGGDNSGTSRIGEAAVRAGLSSSRSPETVLSMRRGPEQATDSTGRRQGRPVDPLLVRGAV